MGCDIHLHIEVQYNKEWHHWSRPEVPRWYRLFAKMCGVRGEGFDEKPIKESIKNRNTALYIFQAAMITEMTRMELDYMGESAHDFCIFSCEDIKEISEWVHGQKMQAAPLFSSGYTVELWPEMLWGYLLGNSMWYMPERVGIQDVRFVFWFDN